MVLAQHLWDIGEVPETDVDLPRRLKDVVSRAVGGRGISHQTLGWFVGAFDMSEADESALWRRLEDDLRAEAAGADGADGARGSAYQLRVVPDPDSALASARPTRATAPYRTQSLMETFEVGADRSRHRHTLVHVLRAAEQLDRISYRFDTADVRVQVTRGGTARPLQPDYAPGMHSLDVLFPAPLLAGQSTVVETIASYPSGGPPVTEFRRGLRATAGGVSLEVRFDPGAAPTSVRWAEFERSAAGELHTEETPLPASAVVHRFLTPRRDCVVGFEWDW